MSEPCYHDPLGTGLCDPEIHLTRLVIEEQDRYSENKERIEAARLTAEQERMVAEQLAPADLISARDAMWNGGMFVTKDSGVRAEYETGMVRDTEEGKARFDLLFPLGVPYREQMLTRFADLMARGAQKYAERNWEKARTDKELTRYRSSAFRHLMQWLAGETDEDHAAAVMFNLMAGETVKWKMRVDEADPC